MDEYTEAQFLREVKAHKLTIVREDGLYRHLRVAIPGTSMESWNIHTWPGYLAMVGDMGDWVFQRTKDMLCFFRRDGESLRINPSYWAEKLQASERGGWEKFDIDTFHEQIKTECIKACGVETWEEVPEERRDDVDTLLRADDEWDAVAAVREFNEDWLDLSSFWESSCKVPRHHYLFACYAIAWTVKLYDAARPATTPEGGGR